MDSIEELEKKDLPPAPSLKKAIGVGIVVMGLAMGTGELILWPHIVTKYGLNFLWLAFLGITFQYFINQEVGRQAVITGESFFTRTARLSKWFAPFWIISAILLYVWPGWASALGTTLTELFGFGTNIEWGIAALCLVLVITFSGKFAYKILENTLKIIVPTFFVLLVIVSLFNFNAENLKLVFENLFKGFSYSNFPPMDVLLGAIVFAGAGGMLNLCVSLWYRDKGIGMGHYAGRISNPITGKVEAVSPLGSTFHLTRENMHTFRKWMHYVRVDQGIIFWLLGVLTLTLICLNAFVVLTPMGIAPEGLQIAVVQAHIFGEKMGIIGYKMFLAIAFLMLFSVMWAVVDALSRITSDILHTNSRVGPWKRFLTPIQNISLSHLYYFIITLVVILGIFLMPMKQPLTLLTISAVLGGMTMAVYTPVLLYMNNRKLPPELRPGKFTNFWLIFASLFFIAFSVFIIWTHISKFFNL